jgi:uncharacterized protein (UPF0335 family)
MLKKFGVKSPAELEGDKKKEFYDALDAGWEGDDEEPEAGDKKESAVAENCGGDHSGKGKCPECGKQLTEGKLDGIAKALTSLASKPEYKKVAKNLKSLAMRASEGDKKAAKQVATQLDKLIMKVGKKEAKKLMSIADLAMTYEDVNLDEALSSKAKSGFKTAMKTIKKDKEVKRLKSKSDVETFMDYTGMDIIFALDLGDNESNEVIAAVTTELQKGMKEAVHVDMRTRGYKEAIKRGLLRSKRKEAKKTETDAILDQANAALTGESMVAGGSDSTGEIAGKDMPLKKKKTLKRFKHA